MKRVFVGFVVGLMGMIVGCGGEGDVVVSPVVVEEGATAEVVATEEEPAVEPELPTAVPTGEREGEMVEEAAEVDYTAVGYTYIRPDGNRLVAGVGGMPEAGFVDVALGEVPLWVVGGETAEGEIIWAVALRDGRVVFVDGGEVVESAVGQPPALAGGGLLTAEGSSPRSHPVLLPDGRVAAILENGDVGVFGVDGVLEGVRWQWRRWWTAG